MWSLFWRNPSTIGVRFLQIGAKRRQGDKTVLDHEISNPGENRSIFSWVSKPPHQEGLAFQNPGTTSSSVIHDNHDVTNSKISLRLGPLLSLLQQRMV
ncbi:hypothetical protein AMECASPLE_032549 [Ameca splendens]|uniref:Uncharacterized protein n=1 Tax=Ameca splendens TaxID=208324 RepID=A0ABV0XW22_9TELE